MGRQNVAFIAFNRGLVSPVSLARIDLERTQLSAEVMTNWIPRTQGAMAIRPGTKYLGSSLNDTGAAWVEFIAAIDQTALLELTPEKMRVWLMSDTGNTWETPAGGNAGLLEVPLARPSVSTTTSLTDTGWNNTSTGGSVSRPGTDLLAVATAETTDGVQITASSYNSPLNSGFTFDQSSGGEPWRVADDKLSTVWQDTGVANNTLPSWLNVDLDAANSGDTGKRESVRHYHIASDRYLSGASPRAWRLITGNFDTGTYATDTGKWTLEDERTGEINWGPGERRAFTLPGADTGTVEARRHWRYHVVAADTGSSTATAPRFLRVAELEMFRADASTQVTLAGGRRVLNASAHGSLARAEHDVAVGVADENKEHSLVIRIDRGPVTIRVGSSAQADNYIPNKILSTGYHNLALTPSGRFHITLQTEDRIDRIVGNLAIGDSGTVELTTPWAADDLADIRHDQSADVIYAAMGEAAPQRLERSGAGRSWSVVRLEPSTGPFLTSVSSSAKLSVSQKYGNTDMHSDIAFFTPDHVGALVRLTHNGQSGTWTLGAREAVTESIQVVGISDTGDTGSPSQDSERRLDFSISGTYTGGITIERSFDGPDFGFHKVSESGGYIKGGLPVDTGTFARVVNDPDDNTTAWYRARMSSYTSGAGVVTVTYNGQSTSGVGRITGYNSPTNVDLETQYRFSDTGATDIWEEGSWSSEVGYPTSVALHAGRLAFAKGATLSLSASDDYENFDDTEEGDAAPILRTLGSGPVDNIYYLLSLLRLVIGTAGAEIALRSSSLDEPVTPENSNARTFSTQGSANLRAIKLDSRGIFVQRSGRRLFSIGFSADSLESDYGAEELTALVPELLDPGVVSIAVQRQPDTRIHCVLADGTVAILTFEPLEEVLCWSLWEGDTGTAPTVEKAMVLPGSGEDSVYYHVRRTVNGVTKRYLERWATEEECVGDTGLSWLMDCAKSYTDTGHNALLPGFSHLAGEQVVVWSSDTGLIPGVDRSPDVMGVQTTYAVDTGAGTVTLSVPVHHAVVGLPYKATWKSTKLAYAVEQGNTALAQMKRTDKIGFVLYQAHNNGLFFGNDTGTLDALPRVIAGATVDADLIHQNLDQVAMPFPGLWSSDSRMVLRGKSPRPVTMLAAIPTIATNEKI